MFRESIARVENSPAPGDLVTVSDEAGRTLGFGLYSPESLIAVRLFSREPREIDRGFFEERLAAAWRLRQETLGVPVFTDGYRVVHSEGDRLPGLIVDYYAGHLVVQFSTVGMFRRKEMILDALEEICAPKSIHALPDRRVCRIEGIPAESGLLRGQLPGHPPSILENGVEFRIHLGAGQKTGHFFDQRVNRRLVGLLSRDRTVLDLHTYTGGFGLYAAANGADEVLGIDSSGPALALAAENAMLNNGRQVRFERADARDRLNDLHREGRRFGMVILDPPRLARTRAHARKARGAYRDLHLRALRVVETAGLLAISSCSGPITEEEFEATLVEAAYDVHREVQILHRGGQAPDHPVLATCPEGRYLKFLLACVT